MPSIGAPSKSTGYFKPADHNGDLLLFEPLRVIRDYVFPGSTDGPKDVTEANVFVLSGDAAGTEYLASKIGQKMLRNALNTKSDFVLGRLAKGQKVGAGIPWVLNEATADEIKAAEKYLAERDGADGDDTGADDDPPF